METCRVQELCNVFEEAQANATPVLSIAKARIGSFQRARSYAAPLPCVAAATPFTPKPKASHVDILDMNLSCKQL
jgi:hypothetical protein